MPRACGIKVYISTCLLALFFVGPVAAAGVGGEPTVSCARCIVVDESGTVLWSRNPRDRYPNASTTKMVTAILAAKATEPGDAVTVSSTAGAVGGGGLDLSAGDTYTADALMYAMLLDSSNEAAQALAERVGGSSGAFVDRMNRYLASIGARRTQFVNPHGLDAEGHYASAGDLALIGAELLSDPYLAEIVATAETTIATPRGRVRIENRNLLLEGYEGAIGIKTGRTLGAGNVLVAAAERDGKRLIAVVMNSYDSFVDAAALLDFGFAELRRLERTGPLIDEGETIGEFIFDEGSVALVAGSGLEGLLPRAGGDLSVTIEIDAGLTPPIERGETVGIATVAVDQRPLGVVRVGSVPAIAQEAVPDVSEEPWWAAPIVSVVSFVGGLLA